MLSRVAVAPSKESACSDQRHNCLDRNVFGVMGIPIDAIDMAEVIVTLKDAAKSQAPFVLSTPNLNFLVMSREDARFRESLLMSDLCPPDGMAIVWLARLLGVPVRKRIAGSDIFDALKKDRKEPLKIYLFGGADGLGAFVADKINSAPSAGLKCVGAISPGYGTVEQLSAPAMIKKINDSRADFVAAFLGAKKGQEWLFRNHDELTPPIRAHLGATINYQAGNVRRAPSLLQASGLEWLWRVKEEPYLWRRYLWDGLALLRMFATGVLPILALKAIMGLRSSDSKVEIVPSTAKNKTVLCLSGAATASNVSNIIAAFHDAVAAAKNVVVDLSGVTSIDSRMFGLLVMLRKALREQHLELQLQCRSTYVRSVFRMNGFAYLLS